MEQMPKGTRSIHISDEVLAKVSSLAAQDVEGAAGLAGSPRITNVGGAIAVTVRILVAPGSRAVQVAREVQQKVKQGIQDMTGVTAVSVDVQISAIASE
ncbi:MAG: Asp23/Gls24 family envelope stress response protein [Oscillospiraceae bacterium]|nr:Asp23/Gls24 family envelope stress response protein [Oscillospiraceae bacterium]